MKLKLLYISLALSTLVLFEACSSGKETVKKEEKKVVDVVPPKTVKNVELEERTLVKKLNIKSVDRLSFNIDEDGKPVSSKKLATIKYNEQGFPVETINYDDSGKVESIFTYTYDKDKRTSTIRSAPTGEKEKKYTYEYNTSGNKIRSERFDMQGNLEKYYIYKYDDSGNLTEDLWYDKSGKLEYRIEYSYDNEGNKIEAKTYDENNVLLNTFKLLYDDRKQLIEEQKIDPSGSRTGIIQYVYQYY